MDGRLTKVFVLVVLIGLSAFFSSSESALFSLGRMRTRRILRFGFEKFRAAEKLLQNPTDLISTLLVGNEIVNTTIQVVAASLIYDLLHNYLSQRDLTIVTIIIILPLLLLFGEIIPKTFGLRTPERVAAFNSVPLLYFSNTIRPIRKALAVFPRLFLKFFKPLQDLNRGLSEDVLRSMLDTGTVEGVVNTHEQKLIHNVFRLDDIKVSQIMSRKNAVSYLKQGDSVAKAIEKFKSDSYSRFPVLDRSDDRVVGVIYAKDLIGKNHTLTDTSIDRYLRQPLIVAPDTNALVLFTQFKTFRMHFATVVDPSTDEWVGVVTFEDVLEEIFGAIRDERDVDEEKKLK